jgi:hypothetical protein
VSERMRTAPREYARRNHATHTLSSGARRLADMHPGAPMTVSATRVASLLLAGALTATPCLADSFASSASSAGSASVGSLSDSFKGSSNSSATTVAEGDYRIIEVAAVAERPGMLRLRLQAATAAGDADALFLDLPQKALAPHGLVAGDVVTAKHRPYGIELARGDTHEPFFLLLADDWRGDLDPRAVTL